MKVSFWMIALGLIFVLTLGVLSARIADQASSLNLLQSRLADEIYREDFSAAKETFEQLQLRISDNLPLWKALMEHETIHEISDTLSELNSALLCNEMPEALRACAHLGNHLSNVQEENTLQWVNLL